MIERFLRRLTPAQVVALFTFINVLNYLDRGIVPGAFDSIGAFIRADLGVQNTDVQIGLLQSMYIVGYALASVTYGHLVHTYPPFKLMASGLLVWTLSTLLSGWAPRFWVLVCARVLSGVGEASFQTVVPPYIDDNAPPAERGLWLSLFFMAIPVGTAAGYAWGGNVATALSWRWAFFIEAIPMAPLVVLVWYMPYRRGGKVLGGRRSRIAGGGGGPGVANLTGGRVDVDGGGGGRGGGGGAGLASSSTPRSALVSELGLGGAAGSGSGAGTGTGGRGMSVERTADGGFRVGVLLPHTPAAAGSSFLRRSISAGPAAGSLAAATPRTPGGFGAAFAGSGEGVRAVEEDGGRGGAGAGGGGLDIDAELALALGDDTAGLGADGDGVGGGEGEGEGDGDGDGGPIDDSRPTFISELVGVLSEPIYMSIVFGYAGYTAVLAGMGSFGPTITKGLGLFSTQSAASLYFGGAVSAAGAIGTPLGGYLIDLATRRRREAATKGAVEDAMGKQNAAAARAAGVPEAELLAAAAKSALLSPQGGGGGRVGGGKGAWAGEDDIGGAHSSARPSTPTPEDAAEAEAALAATGGGAGAGAGTGASGPIDDPNEADLKMIVALPLAVWATAIGTVGCMAGIMLGSKSPGLFFTLLGLGALALCTTTAGVNQSIMAAVKPESRSFAIGLGTLLMHVFGDVPAPPIIGALADHLSPQNCTTVLGGAAARVGAGAAGRQDVAESVSAAAAAAAESLAASPSVSSLASAAGNAFVRAAAPYVSGRRHWMRQLAEAYRDVGTSTSTAASAALGDEEEQVCTRDAGGLQITLVITLAWLVWPVLLWAVGWALAQRRLTARLKAAALLLQLQGHEGEGGGGAPALVARYNTPGSVFGGSARRGNGGGDSSVGGAGGGAGGDDREERVTSLLSSDRSSVASPPVVNGMMYASRRSDVGLSSTSKGRKQVEMGSY